MIFNQTEKQEKEYLQQVITTIHDTINTTSTSVKEHILLLTNPYITSIKIISGRTKISIRTKSVPCAKAS